MSLTLLVILVLLALAAMGTALAINGRRTYEKQGQIIPGLASDAPKAWAGAHSPEAKLHRRLGEAVRSLRQHGDTVDETVEALDVRVGLEQQALEIDRRLIAAATGAGDRHARAAAVEAVSHDVAELETLAAAHIHTGGGSVTADGGKLRGQPLPKPQPEVDGGESG